MAYQMPINHKQKQLRDRLQSWSTVLKNVIKFHIACVDMMVGKVLQETLFIPSILFHASNP
jgi:hypothetical protein